MVIADGRLIIQDRETVRGTRCRPAPEAAELAPGAPLKRNAQWPEGKWQCVHDPTGDFVGGTFTFYDLRFTSAKRNWAEGTRFENRRDGKMLVIRKGMLRNAERYGF